MKPSHRNHPPYRNRTLPELVSGNLFLDLGGDYRDAVFVAGSGRGGTTWLSELVNHSSERRFVFEPFHPEKVPLCRGFRRKQYLPPGDERPEYLDAARSILSGRLRSPWTDRFNRKVLARRRLVKDIRANLLLGWMRRHFPEMPVVLLLRHPCAVADSRLRLGWRDNLDEVMVQKDLVKDHLEPFEAAIRAAEDPFERSVFLWCVENYVPLRQSAGDAGIRVVFYERLLLEPEEELPPLFEFLGEDFDGSLLAKAREDPQSRRRAFEWTERVGESRSRRAAEILALFGLDSVYGEGALPRPEGLSGVSETR